MKVNEKIHIDALLYGLYAAIIPMNMIMNYSGAATVNKQLGIVAAAAMIVIMFFHHSLRYFRNPNWGLLVFTCYAVFSFAWSVDYHKTMSSLTTLLSLILIYVVGKMRKFNTKELTVICLFMIGTASALPFFLGINTAISYSRATLVNENGAADQNGLACNLVFVAILALERFFHTDKKPLKYAFAAAIGLIVITVFMTGSRGALVALGLATLYYLTKTFPELKKRKSFWGTVLLIIIAFALLYYYLDNNLNAAIVRRLSLATILRDKGSGRLDIWKNIFKILWDDPARALFGWGYGTQKTVYAKYYGTEAAAHNAFLQMWIDVGLIGLIAFLVGMAKFWKEANRRDSFAANALWLALFATFMTLTFGTNKGAWNVFLLMYLLPFRKPKDADELRHGKGVLLPYDQKKEAPV